MRWEPNNLKPLAAFAATVVGAAACFTLGSLFERHRRTLSNSRDMSDAGLFEGPSFRLRWAVPSDAPHILSMIRQLAVFEKQLHKVIMDEATVRADLEHGHFECLLAMEQSSNCAIGFALFHTRWSTARGLSIYLHDLFVQDSGRGSGIGSALLRTVAKVALSRSCESLQWCAFDWNTKAIDFYNSKGARQLGFTTLSNADADRFVNFAVVGSDNLATLAGASSLQ